MLFLKYTKSAGQSETIAIYPFLWACFSPLSTEHFTKTNSCHQGTLLLSSLEMEKVIHKGGTAPTYNQIPPVLIFYHINNS